MKNETTENETTVAPINPITFDLTDDQFTVIANALKHYADARGRGAKVDEKFFSFPLYLQRRIREKSRIVATIRNLRKSFIAGARPDRVVIDGQSYFSLTDVSVVIGARDAGSIVSKLRFFARQLNDWGHCPTWAATIRDVVEQFEDIRAAANA